MEERDTKIPQNSRGQKKTQLELNQDKMKNGRYFQHLDTQWTNLTLNKNSTLQNAAKSNSPASPTDQPWMTVQLESKDGGCTEGKRNQTRSQTNLEDNSKYVFKFVCDILGYKTNLTHIHTGAVSGHRAVLG